MSTNTAPSPLGEEHFRTEGCSNYKSVKWRGTHRPSCIQPETPLYSSWKLSPQNQYSATYSLEFFQLSSQGLVFRPLFVEYKLFIPCTHTLLGPLRWPIIRVIVDPCYVCAGTAELHVDLDLTQHIANQQRDIFFLKALEHSPHRCYISRLYHRGVAS